MADVWSCDRCGRLCTGTFSRKKLTTLLNVQTLDICVPCAGDLETRWLLELKPKGRKK